METAKSKKAQAAKETISQSEEKAIKILSALYGINDVLVDVSKKIQVGKKINNRLAGNDPAPGTRKQLFVKAKIDGKKIEKTFKEGEVVIF